MYRPRALFLCALALFCPARAMGVSIGNFNTYQSAWVCPQGKIDIGVGTGIYHANGSGYSNLYFVPDVYIHKGIRDGVEIGARGAPFSLGLDLKARITSSTGAALSIGPEVGVSYLSFGVGPVTEDVYGVLLALPLLIGFRIGESAEITFGPKMIYGLDYTKAKAMSLGYGTSSQEIYSSAGLLYLGGSVNLVARFRDLSVIPEIGVYHGQALVDSGGNVSYGEATVIFPGIALEYSF